ncbi:hypothetical protein NUW58_g2370 [Xylaria curta]|uniref:Uncharacterized protein n=1 Tax=Xylaria curta TaxID=42375 RepID=A0ACC1PIL1_9PEZI|nr:hypothetical protein NUW58_g2370 [Xylaria curta]
MRTSIFISVASTFFASALATALPDLDNLPLPTDFAPLNVTLLSTKGSLEKRQPGGVNICHDVGWVNCGYAKQPWNLCIQLDAPWWHSISAIGPDTFNAIVAYEARPTAIRAATDATGAEPDAALQEPLVNRWSTIDSGISIPKEASSYEKALLIGRTSLKLVS